MQAQNEQFIQSLIDRGDFVSREDVLDAAIERWRCQRAEFARLKQMVQTGIDELDRGEAEPLDIDDVISRGQERLTAQQAQG